MLNKFTLTKEELMDKINSYQSAVDIRRCENNSSFTVLLKIELNFRELIH